MINEIPKMNKIKSTKRNGWINNQIKAHGENKINDSSDFPSVCEIEKNSIYYLNAFDIVDNDPTKTNTGMKFANPGYITWDFEKKGWLIVGLGNSETHSYLSDVKKNFEKTKARQPHRIKIHCLQFIIYMLRWQLSTPVMTPIVLIAHHMGIINSWACIGWANLFGCVPFFFIDKFIFVHLRAKIQKVIDRQQKAA